MANFADNYKSGGYAMKESFLVEFFNEGKKSHKKSSDCYKATDYIGSIAGYFEENFYMVLSCAVDGQDQEAMKDAKGQPMTIVDMLRRKLSAEQPNQSRVIQVLKKVGKLDKLPEIEAAIGRFTDKVSADFTALSKKSTEIYHTLRNMGTWEKFEKGLGRNSDNSAMPEDKLFMEDKVMTVMNRLKCHIWFQYPYMPLAA
jgi:hypothetical protein